MPREEQPEMDEAAKEAEKELLEHSDQWNVRAAKWWTKYIRRRATRGSVGRLLVDLTKKKASDL